MMHLSSMNSQSQLRNTLVDSALARVVHMFTDFMWNSKGSKYGMNSADYSYTQLSSLLIHMIIFRAIIR